LIGRFTCSFRWVSERGPRRAIALGLALAALAAGAARPGAGAASVTGTVRVEQAPLRVEGPKHDRDVVLMLDRVGGGAHPPAAARASMDQRGLVFIPHVLAVQKGTTVTFLNNDPDPHNVYFLDDKSGRTLDIGTHNMGVSVDHRFTAPGMSVVLCKLHLEMAAYIVVTDSPWFTAVQLDAATRSAPFAIRNVAPGEYRLSAWHKKLRLAGGPAPVVVPASGTVDVPLVLTTASRAGKGR
jgi:plastocyanin